MINTYPTGFVRKLTQATENQLKYWVRIGIISPVKIGKTFHYSFRDIIKLRMIVRLKKNGLSFQRLKLGLNNLSNLLPESDDSLTRLVIYTDGVDMLVNEKGRYFSATTMQRFFRFDTEEIKNEITELFQKDNPARNLSMPINL
jgi:DNA-binding transcriptional MerR regulator